MAVTLSDNEVSDHESGSDEYGTLLLSQLLLTLLLSQLLLQLMSSNCESVVVDKNPFNGELSENVDL